MAEHNEKLKLDPKDFVITIVGSAGTLLINTYVTHFDPMTVATCVVIGVTTFWSLRIGKLKDERAKKVLKKSTDTKKTEAYSLYPLIDGNVCIGCTTCTAVCPEGDILQMIGPKAVLVNPTKCVGHSLCSRSCPVGAITMVFGTTTNGKQVPDYNENYETNVSGLYIAGELGGMGLIANAIRQGTLASEHAIKNLKPGSGADIDVLIVGAGPAGIAASLTCDARKVKYKCIEQNSLGGTVYNYPRQKLVMSHPAELPQVGKMSFKGNRVTKEDLLAYWASIVKKFNLKIEDKVKFVGLEKIGDFLEVETSKEKIKAQKVILACGVGGTPRKLGLPNEDSEKVAYSLIDPEQYQNQCAVVVGAGDSAVEAAQRLADPKLKNKVHLLVRADSLSRCKEDNKNKVEQMAKDKQLELWYESGIEEIHPNYLIIKKKGESVEIPNDFLLLFMGTVPPFDFLKKMGVGIRTLKGQPLSYREPAAPSSSPKQPEVVVK